MKIIEPSVEFINAPDYKTLLTTIEAAGRTCYKSEDKITDGSAEKFVRALSSAVTKLSLSTALSLSASSWMPLPGVDV